MAGERYGLVNGGKFCIPGSHWQSAGNSTFAGQAPLEHINESANEEGVVGDDAEGSKEVAKGPRGVAGRTSKFGESKL